MATAHLPPQPIVRRVAVVMDAPEAIVPTVMAVVHTLLLDTHPVRAAAVAAVVAADRGVVRLSHAGQEQVPQFGIPLNKFRRLRRFVKMLKN